MGTVGQIEKRTQARIFSGLAYQWRPADLDTGGQCEEPHALAAGDAGVLKARRTQSSQGAIHSVAASACI